MSKNIRKKNVLRRTLAAAAAVLMLVQSVGSTYGTESMTEEAGTEWEVSTEMTVPETEEETTEAEMPVMENASYEEASSTETVVMTVTEAAELLRISLPKMYEFAKSGKIHSIKVGRRILISRSSLMALIKEGEQENGKA